MDDKSRVFFHEVGHFVAHELSHLLYGGAKTKSIIIHPFDYDRSLFVGETNVVLSEDERERNAPARDRLAEYIGNVIYGCMFQAYYLKQPLAKCLDENGSDDLIQRHECLRHHRLDFLKSELSTIEDAHFDELLSLSALDDIMTLDPMHFMVERAPKYYNVDIEALRSVTTFFIEGHKNLYNKFVNALNSHIENIGGGNVP